jgi:ABC-2 type transport system permease protein
MIRRVARLTAAEFIKLGAHPFLYLSLGVLGAATLLSGIFYPAVFQKQETVWRAYHSVQLFGYGFQFGLKLATYVLVIFSSMIIAGEFDRGTVKNLLTRPVSRTDVFVAKAFTVLALGLGLFAYVLYLSLAWGFGRGNLGPVWDDATYVVMWQGPKIVSDARLAVFMCLPAFLAAGFLGLLVSTWTESSGYAVAVALVLFISGDVVTDLLRGGSERTLFFHYGSYSLAKLRELAEGKSAAFGRDIVAGAFPLWASVPSITVALFLPAAYATFRARNITA